MKTILYEMVHLKGETVNNGVKRYQIARNLWFYASNFYFLGFQAKRNISPQHQLFWLDILL